MPPKPKLVALPLLEYAAELVPSGGVDICSSVAGPFPCETKEAAGLGFHAAILRQQGLIDEPEKEEDSSGDEAAVEEQNGLTVPDAEDQPPPGVSWKGSKKKKKNVKKKEDTDMYGLLGLQHERWMASESQIKQAYRKVSLQHHPDKALIGITDEEEKQKIEDKFKMIQEAYETLSNPSKRREYDSLDEFDDSLPSDCSSADFFKVFGPAFRRNSRWSVETKVPDVGDEKTSWEQVDKFYKFWFTFKSWREFPHPDEEDVEQAESREHRRWIERMNSKMREKGKKEEMKRLREFVENAYRIDPRVQKQKDLERLERERKKNEKLEAKRKVEEEAARKKAEEEEQKRLQEEQAKKQAEEAKKQRDAAKKVVKKERQKLRAICAASDGQARLASEDDVDELCTKLAVMSLTTLNESLSAPGIPRPAQEKAIQQALLNLRGAAAHEAKLKEEQKKQAETVLRTMAQRDHEMKVASMTEWTDEEMRMLDKAVAKFPQGTPKRWEQVTAYVRTRPMEEVLLMVKERKGASMNKFKAQEDWKGAQKRQAEVKSAVDLRMQSFSDVQVNLVGEAVKLPAKEPETAPAAPASATTSSSTGQSKPVTSPAADKKAGKSSSAAKASSTTSKAGSEAAASAPCTAGSGTAAAATATVGPATAVDGSSTAMGPKTEGAPDWSEEQELALVKALKQFGKELPDRWERVASVVPGKTKGQCMKRFKELREAFKKK